METLTKDALLIASRQDLITIIESQRIQIQQLQSHQQEMEFKLAWLQRQIFGAKSERFVSEDDAQTMLDLGILPSPQPVKTEEVSYQRRVSTTA